MCCDEITKFLMGGGLNVLKVTGSLDKYVLSIITDEVELFFRSLVTGRVCLNYLKR